MPTTVSVSQLHKFANSVRRSSTIALPRWKEIIKEVALTSSHGKLSVHVMPQDVWTQWNSTYNMLKFALAYHNAIDKATSECSLKLHKYELSVGVSDAAAELS